MKLTTQQYTAAQKLIESSQRILVVPHANIDPDALSSALACYDIFTKLGKDVTVICSDTKPESLNFLPGFEKVTESIISDSNFVITISLDKGVEVDKLRYSVEDNKVNIIVTPKNGVIMPANVSLNDLSSQYDLLCIVDTADIELLGSFNKNYGDLLSTLPVLNIDHHESNNGYGTMQLINPKAASATEVLYAWFMAIPEWKALLTADTATLLLTGLITDTRSFQNPNTTPESLEVAAELLDLGARQQEIIQRIYKTKPLSTLRIWGRALNKIQIDTASGIVWSDISKSDLAEMEATSKETHGILDELISTIPNADVYILFTEIEEGGFKASARSSEKVNISDTVHALFGGGGHSRAAGFKGKDYSNFSLAVLESVQKIKQYLHPVVHAESVIQDIKPVETSTPTKNASAINIVETLEEGI